MRILVADDDRTSQSLLVHTLKDLEYQVTIVENGQKALDHLRNGANGPQLAILDWMMPEIPGPEVCRQLRSEDKAPFVYIILLSARGRKEDIVDGLDAGADDYLIKPFDPAELKSRIRAGERIVRLTAELKRANSELELLAATDALTGVLNRGAIIQRFQEELNRAARQRSSLALVMADIDHFKPVNDTHGHAAGDEALREFTRRIRNELRPYDSIGRYGGEEFTVLMPGVPSEACAPIVGRLRQSICATPILAGDVSMSITASFGAVWLGPGVTLDPETILQRADILLYDAKRNGRNRVEFEAIQPTQPLASP